MIDFFLLGLFYIVLVTTGLALVVLFLLLHEGYEMTKEQKEKPEHTYTYNYGLTRHELNRVVAQVMKNDRQRTVRKRGYSW